MLANAFDSGHDDIVQVLFCSDACRRRTHHQPWYSRIAVRMLLHFIIVLNSPKCTNAPPLPLPATSQFVPPAERAATSDCVSCPTRECLSGAQSPGAMLGLLCCFAHFVRSFLSPTGKNDNGQLTVRNGRQTDVECFGQPIGTHLSVCGMIFDRNWPHSITAHNMRG